MKTGVDMIDEIIADPNSLDVVLDRDPHARPYSDEELLRVIEGERAHRAEIEVKAERRRAKQQGVEENE